MRVADASIVDALLVAAPVPLVVTDSTGTIDALNHEAAALLGLPPEGAVGKPLVAYVGSEGRKQFRRAILARDDAVLHAVIDARGGERRHVEVRLRALDNERLLFALHDETRALSQAQELQLLGDELDRRVAAVVADERTAHLWLLTVLQHAPTAVVVGDVRTEALALANDRARQLVGPLGLETFADFDSLAVTARNGDRVDPATMPLRRALRGETATSELRVETMVDTLQLEVTAAPVRAVDGEVVGVVMLVDDVSKRERRVEAEREWLANAAHELQTPVAAILNATEALASVPREDEEVRERFLAHIGREASRLDTLASALLVLARAVHAGEYPRFELFPLKPVLEGAASALTPAAGVTVRIECDDDVAVLTHRALLDHVLANLAGNAARFTAAGSITFAARLDKKSRVRIDVSDTGTGIPVEHQRHVFQRFYRGDVDSAGTGLGLAIASEAATVLGGHLELASSTPQGTTFSLELPGARLRG